MEEPANSSEAPDRTTAWLEAAVLVALTVTIGAQLLRVFIPSLGWYLRDTVGVGTLSLIPYALAPFALSFLAPLPVRLLGLRRATLAVGALLIVTRLVEQVSERPALDLWMSMIGVIAFLWLLPMLLGRQRQSFALGVLLGLALDTAVKGATRTLDLSWVGGAQGLVTTAVIVVAFGYLLWVARGDGVEPRWPQGRAALLLAFVGPVLLLEWLLLQSQGWVAAAIGWPPEAALLLIVVGNVAALAVADRLSRSKGPATALLILAGALLLEHALTAHSVGGLLFAVMALLGLVAAGVVLTRLLQTPAAASDMKYAARWLGVGHVLFVLLALLYYLVLDQDIGATSRVISVVIGLFVFAGAVAAAFAPSAPVERVGMAPAAGGAALLAVPAVLLIAAIFEAPSPTPEAGYPVAVMTYNIHSAYNAAGRHDPETIAQVIALSGADVVGLQEVSRGRFMDGSTDLAGWLSERLGMDHVSFHGTADPTWGNAILSRYPIESVTEDLLPRDGTLIQRGFTAAVLDLGAGAELLLINTHLQHVVDPSVPEEGREADLAPLHRLQLAPILEEWAGRDRTVLMGDMNAQPGWEQMDLVLDAGFKDATEGQGAEAYTSGFIDNDGDARWKIDWIFYTEDLELLAGLVLATDASDHYPVLAVLGAG